MTTRRELTREELADTQRLQSIWKSNAPALGLTQAKASAEFGFANQSAISQYLNGYIPLNMRTAARFAALLNVPITDISPRFATKTVNSYPLIGALKEAFKTGDNCELVPVKGDMKKIVGNSDFMYVDKSQVKPTKGIFLVGVGDDIKLLQITPYKASYRVTGLVPDVAVTLPLEALSAMNIIGKVSALMCRVDADFKIS
jgi:transcriptional regulator with XRE-family HTH domain